STLFPYTTLFRSEVVKAFERAHAAIKEIVAEIDSLALEAGKKKVEVAKKEISRDFYREVEEKIYVPLAEAMRIKDKLENYGSVDQILSDFVASIPEGEIERRSGAKQIFKGLKETRSTE